MTPTGHVIAGDNCTDWAIAYHPNDGAGRMAYWTGNRNWTFVPTLPRVKRFNMATQALRKFERTMLGHGYKTPTEVEAVQVPPPDAVIAWAIAYRGEGWVKYWCGYRNWTGNPASPDIRRHGSAKKAWAEYEDNNHRIGLSCTGAAPEQVTAGGAVRWDQETGRGHPCASGKAVSWPDETTARQALVQLWALHSVRRERDVYLCPECQRWHFTSWQFK